MMSNGEEEIRMTLMIPVAMKVEKTEDRLHAEEAEIPERMMRILAGTIRGIAVDRAKKEGVDPATGSMNYKDI